MTETTDQAELHERIAVLLAETDGWEYAQGLGLRDMSESMQQHYDKLATAVLAVLPAPAVPVSDDLLAAQLAPLEAAARAGREQQRAAVRAEVLREAADIAEAQRQFKRATGPRWSAQVSENVGILRVADELRRLAACQECQWGVEHTEHCPYPESHNWGCGCPTDQAPASAASSRSLEPAGPEFKEDAGTLKSSGPGRVAGETQQPELVTTWTSGPVAVGRAAEWARQQRAATVDPAMCPRCKGDNREAFELCTRCAAEQPAAVSQPETEA